ncbi:nudC domain-containing protein 3 [Brachionichthys hirsutus]|uniref:nudC domain-containing protein 3 n=1 Tax=Brachionichthys hirsutus TaxID=412623 RepID=UPI0036046D66
MASPLVMTDMYDNALLGILQHVGNIQDFLQVYFGFLYRKTDFYRLLSSPNDKMGFPAGVAEKMAHKTFKAFEKLAHQDRAKRLSELQKSEEGRLVPPAAQELEVVAEEAGEPSAEAAQTGSPSAEVEEVLAEAPSSPRPDSGCRNDPVSVPVPPEEQAAAAGGTSGEGGQEAFQSDPDSYNGAQRENYSWSQDYTDLEVRVLVPKTIIKGRQVSVQLQPNSIQVRVSGAAAEETLMEGELTHRINTETSLWSLEPGSCVVLSLSKTSEVWWNAVLKGEKEIDLGKINRERSMATVDEDEHSVLDRLAFDYHQKLQGKPQSHEMKVHEMLKKGWDSEGSPFRGQQFDPSMFDIPPGAVQF